MTVDIKKCLACLSISWQIETHRGYYAKLVEQCKDKNTVAAEEIERDLHRFVVLFRQNKCFPYYTMNQEGLTRVCGLVQAN